MGMYGFHTILTSPHFEIVEQFRTSNARYVKGFKVGDVIVFRAPMKSGGYHDYANKCTLVKVLPDGTEEVVADDVYWKDVKNAYRTTDEPMDWDKFNSASTCGVKPVFQLKEL